MRNVWFGISIAHSIDDCPPWCEETHWDVRISTCSTLRTDLDWSWVLFTLGLEFARINGELLGNSEFGTSFLYQPSPSIMYHPNRISWRWAQVSLCRRHLPLQRHRLRFVPQGPLVPRRAGAAPAETRALDTQRFIHGWLQLRGVAVSPGRRDQLVIFSWDVYRHAFFRI